MGQTILNQSGYYAQYAGISESNGVYAKYYEFPVEFIKGVEFPKTKPMPRNGANPFIVSGSQDSEKIQLHVYDTLASAGVSSSLKTLYNIIIPNTRITHSLILYPKVPGGRPGMMTQQIYISSMSLDFIQLPEFNAESTDKSYFTIYFGIGIGASLINPGELKFNGMPYQVV